jgi:opacity protein-like surface antigen
MLAALRRSAWIGAFALLLGPTGLAGPAGAAGPADEGRSASSTEGGSEGQPADADEEPDAGHRVGFGLQVGYGYGVASRSRQRDRDVADVRFVAINPHVRTVLWSPGDGQRWFHGDLDGILEGTFLVEVEPRSGFAGGANVLLRYRLLKDHRIRPYAEAGLGIGGLDFGLLSQDDGFSFFLQAGAGARWQINETWSLIGSVRWHHISNAQTHLPNNSIDDVLFMIGVELW